MKGIPYVFAVLAMLVGYVLLRPAPKVEIVGAARDLPEGHVLSEGDLQTLAVEQAPEGAFTDPAAVIGQALRVDRTAGDAILAVHLGGNPRPALQPDERAVAIEVTDSAGLAGLLQPGDRVGVTAVIQQDRAVYAKVVGEGFRVLYISPDFQALDPAVVEAYRHPQAQKSDAAGFSGSVPPDRKSRGTVVLAVPVKAQVVAYDFSAFGVASESRLVNVLDLLPALDHAQNVELSLFLTPAEGERFVTSGVFLPDLVITPGPSPTPTATAGVGASAPITPTLGTPTPTPTP